MEASPSDRPEALLSAMVACSADPDSPAWRTLARLLAAAARTDEAVAQLWSDRREAPRQVPAEWRQLALELDRLGSHDTATERALTDWLRHNAPPPPSSTANVISGSSVLHGPSVQARDIHGGVHFHTRPARPALPVPRQLPPVTALFTGREADRRALDALRDRAPAHAPKLLVVTGLAGVGKTSLAAQWLHQHADSFPDGQLYADLGGHAAHGEQGPVSPATVLESFLTALGAPSIPAGTAQRSALWRSLTSQLRLAVLLDSAFTSAQIRPLLLGTASGLTVVTSRNALPGLRVDGAYVHRLDGLPAESAVELLAVGGGARVEREPVAAREVVRLCGRLPLTVGLASAQLAVRPHSSVSDLVASLSRGPGPVDTLRLDGEAVMRTALDMSYELLPPESAALYRRMGLLPTDRHDLAQLAAVLDGAGAPDAAHTADLAAQSLVEAHLLEETGPGTYRFHDLVKPHARRLGEEREGPDERARTMRNFVNWCLSTATSAERILVPSHRLPGHDVPMTVAPTPLAGPEDALAWLDTHRNGLWGAIRHCANSGWHTSCWRLVDLSWPLVHRFRPSEMWIETHRLGLEAARQSGSRPGEGRMLTSGAIGLRDAGRYEEAGNWYRQALELATAVGDVRQQAQAISGLGHICLLTHCLDQAREHFQLALRLRESVGYRRGAALSRRRLGETALAGGDFAEAVSQLRLASGELTSLEEGDEAIRVRALLGHALERGGSHEEGTGLLLQALTGFRAAGTRSEYWEARCLEWLGLAAELRSEAREATDRYQEARALFQRLNPADVQRLDERLRHL